MAARKCALFCFTRVHTFYLAISSSPKISLVVHWNIFSLLKTNTPTLQVDLVSKHKVSLWPCLQKKIVPWGNIDGVQRQFGWWSLWLASVCMLSNINWQRPQSTLGIWEARGMVISSMQEYRTPCAERLTITMIQGLRTLVAVFYSW